MGRAPHEIISARRVDDAEFDAVRARLEAKYGVPYEKLPEVLRYSAPEHPRRRNPRRYNYRVSDSRWIFPRSVGRPRQQKRLGWRTERRLFLERVEKFRQAEIEVRKLRTKRTGRGKPVDRKAHVHVRERIAAREWRDEL
jgi:hypothetical protein